jgi:hypothetical protein
MPDKQYDEIKTQSELPEETLEDVSGGGFVLVNGIYSRCKFCGKPVSKTSPHRCGEQTPAPKPRL